ncbi:ankyrin repeat domain-containing protein [Endozoicomonas sp. ONNA2]|uniref:ankyrin repeat domain-containing protein n=1 Tax=Endozoicomonas sp. ONNA2 TaxID=2828741 RepID=UPI002147A74E|nr:ankyrin repeat domain-containing protein [Endozoicomonas sp. ONNA2]
MIANLAVPHQVTTSTGEGVPLAPGKDQARNEGSRIGRANHWSYIVDNGRWALSLISGFLYEPLAILGRKIARTEPVASLLLQRYVQEQNTDHVQWMISNEITFDQRHSQLVRQAYDNCDSRTLDVLLKNNSPADELLKHLAEEQEPSLLRKLIESYHLKLNKDHYNLVIFAASIGDVELLHILLEKGVPITHDFEGNIEWKKTPMLAAIRGGHLDAVKLLIARGAASVENNVKLFDCAFHAQQNRNEIIVCLLQEETLAKTVFSPLFSNREERGKAREKLLWDLTVIFSWARDNYTCNNHILCLLLLELGGYSHLNHLIGSFDDEQCKRLCIEGVEKNILDIDWKSGDNFRHMLILAVKKAHRQLQCTRFLSLQALAYASIKRCLNHKYGMNADRFHEAISGIDGMALPKCMKDKIAKQFLDPVPNKYLINSL